MVRVATHECRKNSTYNIYIQVLLYIGRRKKSHAVLAGSSSSKRGQTHRPSLHFHYIYWRLTPPSASNSIHPRIIETASAVINYGFFYTPANCWTQEEEERHQVRLHLRHLRLHGFNHLRLWYPRHVVSIRACHSFRFHCLRCVHTAYLCSLQRSL